MNPIAPDEIRWRVGSTFEKDEALYGILLGYIDARTAMDRLDALDEKWSDEYQVVTLTDDDGGRRDGVMCRLTVNGVTRSDVGVPSNMEGVKGAYSDALKRAAVKHGIARDLYELPTIAVECEFYVGRDGKKRAKKPKALPTFVDGRWTISRSLGWVRYDHDPTEQPRAVAAVSRAAASSPPAGGGPVDEDPGFAPIDPHTGEPLMDLIIERTGGTEVTPDPLQERIARAEAKAGKDWVCPVHGTSKVVPAGVSKKTGRSYNAFTACGESGCNEKPGRRAA